MDVEAVNCDSCLRLRVTLDKSLILLAISDLLFTYSKDFQLESL